MYPRLLGVLVVDLGAVGLVGESGVEFSGFVEGWVCPVRARGGIGEFDTFG